MTLFLKDSEVIEKMKKGDESALEYLYKKNYKMMINLIIKNNGTEEEAKDIYQDALIVFWQKITSGNLEMTSKISTYLYSVCQNLWRKELERKSRFTSDTVEKGFSDGSAEKEEKVKIIQECLGQLGESCRKILSYYYFDELSMNDIAEKMGFANADTAKTKKYKCKLELDRLVKSKFSSADFLD
jgi:RNA polymerase sigma factor (sigma-70 family)